LKKGFGFIALLLALTLICAAPVFASEETDSDDYYSDDIETADDEEQTVEENNSVESSITFPSPPKSMNIGDKTVIGYNLNGAGNGVRIEWASSNPDVASVDDRGEVSANSVGVVEISASVPSLGLRTSTMIQINEIKATSLKIGVKEYSEEDMLLDIHDLEVDKVLHLTAVVEPADVTTEPNITWESSAQDIVAVDSKGTITALKEGDATVTARAGDLTDRIKFNVMPPPGANIGKYLLIGFGVLVLLIIIILIIIIVRVTKRRRREREMSETRAVAADELKNKITKQKTKKSQRDMYAEYMGDAVDKRTRVFTPPITEVESSGDDPLDELTDSESEIGASEVSSPEVDSEIKDEGYEEGPDRPLSLDDID
jgi:hypothetical protein